MLALAPTPPAILASGQAIDTRVLQLKTPLGPHFTRLRTLDRYSRRVKTSWFPRASTTAPSVMLSTIRSAEKTAIAYLAGGKPTWRVASYGGYAGIAQEDVARAGRDNRFERLARAIFHHIDRQSETNLLYEPVERAVRQGEVIFQFGWLDAARRRIADPAMPGMAGALEVQDGAGAPLAGLPGGALPGPGTDPGDPGAAGPAPLLTGPAGDPLAAGDLGEAAQDPSARHRFPLFVRVHDRMRLFYELDPFGEPLEVYHQYTARAAQLAEEFPEWDAANATADDLLNVTQAWVGAWTVVTVGGDPVGAAKLHGYGARPPFVIERCAPENVADRALDDGVAEVRAGIPFCLDMIEAYEQACMAASMKLAILQNAALGAFILENASSERYKTSADGVEVIVDMVLGPGTVFPTYKDEKLIAAPVAALPPAVADYFEQSATEMASLSFSSKLLMGDSQGDPSGYGIEQVRQAAMARLLPYRDALGRAFSRLFEKLFIVLAQEWAPEWGDSVTLAGQHNGEYFAETVRPEDLTPPPDHVEMTLTPAVPQNKIAEQQALVQLVQAGLKDPLSAMEEMNVAEPQEEWDSILLHKEQLENPQIRPFAVAGIVAKRMERAGIAPPGQPGQLADVPEGTNLLPVLMGAGPDPGPGGPAAPGGPPQQGPPAGPPSQRPNQGVPGPGGPMPPAPRQGGRGPAPQQRPGLRPLGVAGAPNPPVIPPRNRPTSGGR